MGRILCAWEFGGDLGHIRRLAALARALRAAGHEPVIAAGNLAYAAGILAGFEWHQAPLINAPLPNRAPLNATDVLLHMGLGEAERVAGALRAWDQLFQLTRPEVLVSDYAPVAMLAARLHSIPRVNIGSGFSLPPRASPMPALRDWHATDDAKLRAIDAIAIDGVNRALRELQASPITAAAELFESELELLCTFAEIDPFGPREAEYFGPLDDSASGPTIDWRGPGPRVLAYLKPRYPLFPDLMRALATLPGESIVAAPGLLEAHATQLSNERVRVIPGTVNLAALLARADLCLGHGSAGFTGRALAAGVPQGMLVMQLEQFLVGRRVETAGAGATVIPEKPVADLATWVSDLAANEPMRAAARRIAAMLPAHDARASAQRAAARIATLMGR